MKIALTGISGSGKDFIVEHLVKNYGYTRLSFSDQLKKLCAKIYPWMKEDYPPFEKEKLQRVNFEGMVCEFIPRDIWLFVGRLRDNDPFMFIRSLDKTLKSLHGVKNIVISDIRTQEEWIYCKNNGFTTIYVEPTKRIYVPNDFDKQVLYFKEKADFVFENNFDGIQSFELFVREKRISI